MVNIIGPPASATRNLPLATELDQVLNLAGKSAGIDTIRVVSGGQPSKGGGSRRTGSTRHDHGRAADIQLVNGGKTLAFTDQDAGPMIKAFVEAAAAYGATGIGAGVYYMGPQTIHVGFGLSPRDGSRLVWGTGEKSAGAPAWLKMAAEKGWRHPRLATSEAMSGAAATGGFTVASREGLRLRNGPGLEYPEVATLDAGSRVSVLGLDGPAGEWARVSLHDDDLIDGHVLATFLASAPSFAGVDADETGPPPETD